MSTATPLLAIGSLAAIAAVVLGCSAPETQDPGTEQCQPLGDDEIGEECEETESDDAAEHLGPGECVYNEDPSSDGYRIQCEGELYSKIDFSILGKNCAEAVNDDFCSQVYPFGPTHDTYEAPDVMACCGEAWDPVVHLDVYQKYCMYDVIGQACASMAKRLEKAIEAGDFDTKEGDFTKKATNLQVYIASHFIDCTAALNGSDADPDPGHLVSHWDIPNKAGPDGWWPAQDIVVSVEVGTNVTDVHRPQNEMDWLECHGAFDNNDEVFEDQTSPKGSIVIGVDLDETVDADLLGPSIGGGMVSGSMTFDTNCVDQGCPSASWSYEEGTDPNFTMEELELYATTFDLTNGTVSLTIDRARVELWTQAPGAKILDGSGRVLGYEIAVGQAWFYVAGLANGAYGRFMAVNSTDIVVTVDHGSWAIDSFDIESVDGADRTWTLTLDDSRWQE